jgi:hypothetical protein
VFVGSAALTRGGLTRGRLRWNYRAIFPDVYVRKLVGPSLEQTTVGAWLWSGRSGVITGRAAAEMHGALWVSAATPIEMIWRCGRPPPGIVVRNERIDADEVMQLDGLLVTTPDRTALDLARHLPRDLAVQRPASISASARRPLGNPLAQGILLGEQQRVGRRHPRRTSERIEVRATLRFPANPGGG